jgi:D-aminopeptidase
MRFLVLTALFLAPLVLADDAPRARDLGIPFEGTPGALNAITDVAGVTVGFVTLVEDLPDGKAVRTGVTAILPRGAATSDRPVFGGWSTLNGNGELTGAAWIEESGFIEGPVMLTNTHSIGAVHEGTIRWRVEQGDADASGYWWSLPVVTETWDGYLNDINGFHVRPAHAGAAIENAHGGAVAEGNVGGGTGMICFDFKCGTGTASRIAVTAGQRFSVGVLVQANTGSRGDLLVAGAPVGKHFGGELASSRMPELSGLGSIIVVVATDAPLLPQQLKRLARRAEIGVGRTGAIGTNGSGDFFIAFSTANPDADQANSSALLTAVSNEDINPLFEAVVQATEEAIANALVAGRRMTGNRGNAVEGIDHEALRQVLRRYNRLATD